MNVTLTGVPGFSRATRRAALLYNYLLSHQTRQCTDEFAHDYVQVNFATLQAFLGKDDYLETLNRLIDSQYLERLDHDQDGQYYPGGYFRVADEELGEAGRCKSFRVPAHLLSAIHPYQVLEVALTKTELNMLANIGRKRIAFEEPHREFVRENMANIALVDSAESRRVLTWLYNAGSVKVDCEPFLDMWNNNLFHDSSVDSFGRRVHAPLTSAPRELRPFMRFRNDMGSPLVEVDFVASQPSLLASITPKLIRRYAPECALAIPYFRAIEGHKNWELYKSTCLDARAGHGIYEHLAHAFEKKFAVPLSRDEGKTVYYRACFSNYRGISHLNMGDAEAEVGRYLAAGDEKNHQRASSQLFTQRSYHVFKEEFPRVHQLFRDLKSLNWGISGQGAPHANNCLLAQRIESGLVYTTLIKALVDAGITQVVTIHDAVLIRKQDEERTRRVIQRELNRLKLNLRIKCK